MSVCFTVAFNCECALGVCVAGRMWFMRGLSESIHTGIRDVNRNQCDKTACLKNVTFNQKISSLIVSNFKFFSETVEALGSGDPASEWELKWFQELRGS